MASNPEGVDPQGTQQPVQVHLQSLESHGAFFARMRELATRAEHGWTGQAGADFQSALEAWMANYQKVGAVLDEMHQRIVGTGKAQTQTHESTTSTAGQLTQQMHQGLPFKGF
ncbi:hypothetical protein ACWD5Q_35160 [Streptomyces sp. NPDC002513]